MATNLFISWSGPLSQRIAGIIREWMPTVLQSVEPFLSSEDIEKGARWSDHIATKLEECGFGIIVLTADNLSAPWIMFEAGALSKMVGQTNVAPVLIEVAVAKVRPPLSQFQATKLDQADFLKLVKSINKVGETPVKEESLDKTFAALWPQFQTDIEKAISDSSSQPAKTDEADDFDLKSLGLSVGDLIKSVQSLRDDMRLSGGGAGIREALDMAILEFRDSSRWNESRIPRAAVRDMDEIADLIEKAIAGSKSERVILSKQASEEIREKSRRLADFLNKIVGRERPSAILRNVRAHRPE